MRGVLALFVRRPVFTWVLVLGVVVLGLNSLWRMPVERFPNVEFGYVTVTIAAPGLSSEQIEGEIATRVENALGTVSGLERLDSASSEGQAFVAAQFVLEKDPAVASNEVRDRVSRLADELPASARPARIETFNLNAMPIMLLAVDSPHGARTPLELTEIADTTIRRELQAISGVGDVRLVGGEARAMSIVLDPLRLRSVDMTAQEVGDALAREDLEVPGGTVADGEVALGVRLSAKARTAAELAEVIIGKRGNLSVRLGDVARVEDGRLPSDSRASLSGRPSVIIAVTKQPGANTVAVTDEVRGRLAHARDLLPDGVEARVIQDNSEEIRASLSAVTEHLVLGAVLAAVVVFVFLRSWRATLIAGLAIPSSILGTFMIARALGMSLNMLSLLGLTLAVGIVIDDAIVVVENIVRMIQVRRLSARTAAVEATQEIALAVLATTLSLVAVFVPVATMEGIVGRYLAPFSLTMTASILISMGIAFTLTPMLASRWLKGAAQDAGVEPASQATASVEVAPPPTGGLAHPVVGRDARQAEHDAHAHDGPLERFYGGAVAWILRRRWVAGIAIVVALGSIVPIAAITPATFLPIEDSARFAVYMRLPESASVERTAQVAEEVGAKLRALTDVTDTAMTTTSPREATVTAYLGRRGLQAAMIEQVRATLQADYAGQPILIMVGPSDDMSVPGPDTATIQYVVRGARLDELGEVTGRLLEEVKKIPGTVDHGLSTAGSGKPELSVKVDRAVASKLGVSQAEIGRALRLLDRKGVELGNIRDLRSKDDVSLKMLLRVGSDVIANDDLVRSLTVRSDAGALLPLSDIASFVREDGPGIIRRVGRQRQITVFMNTVAGTSDVAVLEAIEAKMKEIEPTGRYRGEVIGNAKEMEKAATAFLVAIVLSFVFMYLVLAAQFESWIHPLTILLSLPLTLPFGLISLVAGGQTLNIFSALGFLVLFGIVKKNSILQVDRMNQLRAQGMPRDEAVLTASRDRLRPILMTTLAFVAGMLPLVVSSGAGAATNRAIAVGILGGQTLSLALTLLVTPVVYTWFDDVEARWTRRARRSATGEASPSRGALEGAPS